MTISEYFKDYDFLFDSHAHLSTGSFENVDDILKRAEESGVKKIFDMGVDLKSSKEAVQKAASHEGIAAFVGIDPEVFETGAEMFIGFEIGDDWFEEQYKNIKELISNNKEQIAGVGETGIDFFHFKNESEEVKAKSTQQQERLFRTHLEIAKKFSLPVSVHSRAAEGYCLEIVKTFPDVTGIFHSFTGNYETAVKILDSGWGLGVNGIVTFKSAGDLREMYKKILGNLSQAPTPEYFYSKGIFFETDSPYLSPEGKRGEPNEPANVKITYDQFVEMLKN